MNQSVLWVPSRKSNQEYASIASNHKVLMDLVKSEIEQIKACTWLSTLFVLTDCQGTCLSLYGSQHVLERLEEVGIGAGTSFAMQHAGINAISMAMDLNQTSVLKGNEHSLELFSEWNCICQPIKCGKQIVGYLDMSFSVHENYILAIPLLEQIVKRIEEKYVQMKPEMKQQSIYEMFDLYSLAPREKEVGYLWLQNKSALFIAESLGVTEGTVRTVIKRIYQKTEVSDKGIFYRKFST